MAICILFVNLARSLNLLFFLTRHKGNIFITDDDNVSITDISVYSKACRWILHPHATIPIERSSLYQARERIYSGTDTLIVPTKPMDVYAFGSIIYAVRFSIN